MLLEAYAGAGLSDLGAMILGSGAVHSLRMRLRATEWFRRHPEIADEVVDDPIVVVGMMRSGTTLAQRLLAADPRFHCAHGWEVIEVAPRSTTTGRRPTRGSLAGSSARSRRRRSRRTCSQSIPCTRWRPRRRSSSSPTRSSPTCPNRARTCRRTGPGSTTQDFTPAYDHLHRMLQLLQWQKRQRGELAERWVLKTPAHLGYLDDLRARFPGVHVVHLHRDPRETIPSGASLNTVLHRMHADDVDPVRVGTEWIERMGWTNDRAALETPGEPGTPTGDVRGSPTSPSGTSSATRSVRWRGSTTRSVSTSPRRRRRRCASGSPGVRARRGDRPTTRRPSGSPTPRSTIGSRPTTRDFVSPDM